MILNNVCKYLIHNYNSSIHSREMYVFMFSMSLISLKHYNFHSLIYILRLYCLFNRKHSKCKEITNNSISAESEYMTKTTNIR